MFTLYHLKFILLFILCCYFVTCLFMSKKNSPLLKKLLSVFKCVFIDSGVCVEGDRGG